MPNNKKRSHSRTITVHKADNKKVPKNKMSFRDAEKRHYTVTWNRKFKLPPSKDYLERLRRQFELAVRNYRGGIQCGIHDFQTDNWQKWNEHIEDEPHTIMGSIACVHCNKSILFENIPIIPFMTRRMQCKHCKRYTRIITKFPWDGPATIEIIR